VRFRQRKCGGEQTESPELVPYFRLEGKGRHPPVRAQAQLQAARFACRAERALSRLAMNSATRAKFRVKT
jgi:hypothetical protein